MTELPLNGRQATELVMLSGLATPAPSADLQTNKNYPTATISVAGGAANGMTYIMDGGSHNDPFNNLNLPTPFPDALQEFKVETSSLPARYGHHSAAAVNVITKSGTNCSEAWRSISPALSLQREELFRPREGQSPPAPVRRHAGWACIENRLFFFAAYQGKVEKTNPTTAQRFVPTAAMRAGDFTAFASPACNNGRQTESAARRSSTTVSSPSAFSPAAMKLLNFVPVSDDPCGLYQFGIPNDNDRESDPDESRLTGSTTTSRSSAGTSLRSTTTRPSTTARTY